MAYESAYPGAVWDGKTNFRSNRNVDSAPDAEDWTEVLAEVRAIEETLLASPNNVIIWVGQHDRGVGTGSITNPMTSVSEAAKLLTPTKRIIVLLPGEYDLGETIVLPDLPIADSSIRLIGLCGSSATIINASDADEAIQILPLDGTAEQHNIAIEGITLNQYPGKIGIKIIDALDASTTKLTLKDVKLNMDTSGASFFQNTTYGAGCQLEMIHSDATGLIDFAFTTNLCNNSFLHCNLLGGVSSATDSHTIEFLFRDSVIKAGGVSGGFATQTIIAINCFTDANEAVSESDFVGAHTVTILGVGSGGGGEPAPNYVDDTIWVGPQGTGDGSLNDPFGSINDAVAVMTNTKHIVCVLPGTYSIDSPIRVPTVNHCSIIGIGGSGVTRIDPNLDWDPIEDNSIFVIEPTGFTKGSYLIKGFSEVKGDANAFIYINLTTSNNAKFEIVDHVQFYDVPSRPVIIDSLTNGEIRIKWFDCRLTNIIKWTVSSDSDEYVFERCSLQNRIESTSTDSPLIKFSSCHMQGVMNFGVGVPEIYVINCHREIRTSNDDVESIVATGEFSGPCNVIYL